MSARKRARSRSASGGRSPLSEDDPWLLTRIRESIASGLVVVDSDGRIVSFNRAAEEITGLPRGQVQGRRLDVVFGAHNLETLERELAASDSSRDSRRLELDTGAGRRQPIGYSISPLVDEAGARLGAIVIFKDLTEIEQLHDEVRRREHFASVGEMTASIAHEIRNPLASMQTAAETLREELGYDEDKEEYLKIILREVQRVNALVSDFSSFVRPMSPQLEPLDVHGLLDVLVFIEGAKMKRSGVTLRCRLQREKLSVVADRNLLQQALLNILLNAHQASPDAGEIVISTGLEERAGAPAQVSIRIADQGPGIPAAELDKIFEPFYSTKIKGIGLGLPITDRIMRAMGGRIEVHSAPGHGTEFTLLLPRAEA